MTGRALQAVVPFAWFTADETYRQAKWLQAWPEERDVWYVMAIRCSDTLATTEGEQRAGVLIAAVPARSWQNATAGTGCWPAAPAPIRRTSLTTPVTGPAAPAPPAWPGPPEAAGTSRNASSKPKAKQDLASTRSGRRWPRCRQPLSERWMLPMGGYGGPNNIQRQDGGSDDPCGGDAAHLPSRPRWH